MVQFNPYNVIMLLYVTFTALNLPKSPITSKERETARKIEVMLQEMRDERCDIEEEISLDYDNDNDIIEAEQVELQYVEHEDEEYILTPKFVCTTDERISHEYRKQAVEYWKSGKIGTRTLEGVKRRFRKVSSLRQLRRWEIQVNEGGSRY